MIYSPVTSWRPQLFLLAGKRPAPLHAMPPVQSAPVNKPPGEKSQPPKNDWELKGGIWYMHAMLLSLACFTSQMSCHCYWLAVLICLCYSYTEYTAQCVLMKTILHMNLKLNNLGLRKPYVICSLVLFCVCVCVWLQGWGYSWLCVVCS